jgi:hypothetical protein
VRISSTFQLLLSRVQIKLDRLEPLLDEIIEPVPDSDDLGTGRQGMEAVCETMPRGSTIALVTRMRLLPGHGMAGGVWVYVRVDARAMMRR